nr:ABC transporter ATP-binding protein [Paenibacillus turpanensis]
MTNAIVSTHQLSKRYGGSYSVQDVNLSVHEGEIYGFLGPNGAGKTTTLKMILGLVHPTKGQVTVFGKELQAHRRSILSLTGSLIESPSYYGHLTGLENLRVVQRLREVPNRNVLEALRIVRLEQQKNKKVSQYSLGMKQRLGIAMALLSFPKLLVLDEPTNGLDPAGIGEIRELITSLPQRFGMTVLISSHLLSEVELIATNVGIIHQGQMRFQGSMEKLRGRSRAAIRIRTSSNLEAERLLTAYGLKPVRQGESLALGSLPDAEVARANRELLTAGIDVLRIEETRKSLEDIFLDLTGKEISL